MFEYKATVDKVVDGDTIDVTLDLGFRIYFKERLRLDLIDAPEMNQPGGREAKAYVEQVLPLGSACTVQTYKNPKDKYGRWLAVVTLPDGRILNDEMIYNGHAKRYGQ
jgi:endonuclease YncB( thermonuclease family)